MYSISKLQAIKNVFCITVKTILTRLPLLSYALVFQLIVILSYTTTTTTSIVMDISQRVNVVIVMS